jgi:DNA (cytosine-5)-methyltransferase 1
VSLYTGAGGLDYGLEAAGFEIAFAIDFDPDSCSTIRANRPWPVVCDDIHSVPTRKILDTAGLRRAQVDVLSGGPPCQPFSKSSYWVSGDSKRLDDPRATTLHAYMRCVEELLPEAFLFENVHGISYSGKEEGFVLLEKLTRGINRRAGTNYRLSWKVLNAADYGVPQIRTRFFLVGHREGKTFQFPAPTHYPDYESAGCPGLGLQLDSRWPYVTAWDAIGDYTPLPNEDLRVRGYWADLLPSIPEGENYLWHTNRKGGRQLFGWRTRFWSFLLKLAKNRPSWTVQAQPGPAIGPFHWMNRRLSVEEMARLQTFPRNLSYVGNRNSLQRQLGNAVPSLLSEVLAREMNRQFFGASVTDQPKLAVEYKRPIPPPEPLSPVPERYLTHLGDHADHPGEGKGRRAALVDRPAGADSWLLESAMSRRDRSVLPAQSSRSVRSTDTPFK